MLSAIFIILLLHIGIFILVYSYSREHTIAMSFREIILVVWTVIGVLIVAVTEILSLFDALTPANIRISWIVFVVLVWLAAIKIYRNRDLSYSNLYADIMDRVDQMRSLSGDSKLLIIIIFFQTSTLALINILYPIPSNHDAMTYHLPRLL